MKCIDDIKDRVFSHYPQPSDTIPLSSEGLIITCECPFCKEYTDIEIPDLPAKGNKFVGWCIWCGKEFVYYY